ncbi:MAG: bifunctional folylpolyglutamate synthase/dihydrofolate synthase [Planctomycetia bacterium]|nr:bifunctional folylpolyglutamate synthase/dihydrofolate synthase [Planctomycetia bacterium]
MTAVSEPRSAQQSLADRDAAAADFLTRRINYERTPSVPYLSAEFKLDRMRRLMSLLGDPQLGLKAIHIAGTKGKGSTAAMIASVLTAAGYKTGLYTSPHLKRIEERLMIDGQICPPDRFLELAAQVQPAVEQLDHESAGQGTMGPTFFEVTTAMAFLHFAQAKVDAAVLEVGLGGRLDSTNVCNPEVCIITSISFDHVRQLGNTLAAIAAEKAGIIKPGVPVISCVISPEPRETIAHCAAELAAPLFQRGVDFDLSPQLTAHDSPRTCFSYREPATSPTYELRDVELNLLGSHQAANAAAAVAAINRLRDRGWSIGEEEIRRGLAAAHIPARIEQIQSSPAIILDVAHNLASIQALLAVLRERFAPHRRIAIFASSKDKDYTGMLKLVLPAFDVVFLTQYIHNPRAAPTESLLATALEIRRAAANGDRRTVLHATVRPQDALRLARSVAGVDDLICIAGSFFLAAELRPVLQPQH